jgi:hypothetical protein
LLSRESEQNSTPPNPNPNPNPNNKNTTQKTQKKIDTHGGHQTNLGLWKGFTEGYTHAVFDGGDWCHQAPARSLTVAIVCGAGEAAWDGGEPSTCAYTSTLSTPAACSAAGLAALEAEYASLLAEEAALRAEIEAEAAAKAAAEAAGGAAGQAARDEL